MSGFPESEYRRRCKTLQGGMKASGLDALLVTTEADLRYLTGFLTRFWESPTRPWFAVLPAKGAPIAVIPGIGAELMATTWIADIRTWPAPRPGDDGVGLLAEVLAGLVPASGAVGLPMGPASQLRMPLADFKTLRHRLAPRRFADAAGLIADTRAIKSEPEIARIREICAIAGRAFDRVPGFATTGTPLSRIFREFQIALLDEGADWVPYVAGGAGPGGYGDVISPASDRPLAAGDVLMLDTGAVKAGYFCDYDRNWSVGKPAAETAAAQALLHAATEAGLAAARPGATAADVFHAMQRVIARAGEAGAGGRLGHGVGMQLTEGLSLTAEDRTELRPGMVITLEPGIQIGPGRMLVHEEDIVIRDGAAELLTPRAPATLPILS
ncbi:M24 family metallopeptidase [Acidimangrovimonas pyrenivorans]|uniref:M24 family metallopeptidase n=1 Tax=Acidimangrovimonas pyrenivorans TaxID=2030798 RepID=A0ABV7AEI1_9RHOB